MDENSLVRAGMLGTALRIIGTTELELETPDDKEKAGSELEIDDADTDSKLLVSLANADGNFTTGADG